MNNVYCSGYFLINNGWLEVSFFKKASYLLISNDLGDNFEFSQFNGLHLVIFLDGKRERMVLFETSQWPCCFHALSRMLIMFMGFCLFPDLQIGRPTKKGNKL